MGITLGSNFTVNTSLPLDDRMQVADNTARDAIAAGRRYEGLIVYSIGAGTNYQLVGGILNANWTELAGGGGGGTTVIVQRFSGDAATLVFTLSNDPIAEENTQIYINGVYQQKDTYSVSGVTITFTGAPPIGTSNIEVTYFTAFSVASIPAGGVGTTQLADNSVTLAKMADASVGTAELVDASVTNAKKGAPNFVQCAAIAAWSNSSVTPTDVTDLTVSFTTSGRLLEVGLYNSATGIPRIFARSDLVADDDVGGTLDFLHGSTVFYTDRFSMRLASTSTVYEMRVPTSSFKAYVTLAAGTYTFKVQAYALTNNSIYIRDVRLYVREL